MKERKPAPEVRQIYRPPAAALPWEGEEQAPARELPAARQLPHQEGKFKLYQLSSLSRDDLRSEPGRRPRFEVRDLNPRRGRSFLGMDAALGEAGIDLNAERTLVRARVGIGDGSHGAILVLTDVRAVLFAPGRVDRHVIDIPRQAITDISFNDAASPAVVSIGYLTPMGGQRLGVSARRFARTVLAATRREGTGWGAVQTLVGALTRVYLRARNEEGDSLDLYYALATALGYEVEPANRPDLPLVVPYRGPIHVALLPGLGVVAAALAVATAAWLGVARRSGAGVALGIVLAAATAACALQALATWVEYRRQQHARESAGRPALT